MFVLSSKLRDLHLRKAKAATTALAKMGEQPIDVPSVNGRFVKRTYLKIIAKRLSLEKQ
jgi:hypothetical protein